MRTFYVSRESIIKQAVQNMIEAGIVKPCEYDMFTEQLYRLDPKDLLTVLMESHQFREQLHYTDFFPVDINAMCMN